MFICLKCQAKIKITHLCFKYDQYTITQYVLYSNSKHYNVKNEKYILNKD